MFPELKRVTGYMKVLCIATRPETCVVLEARLACKAALKRPTVVMAMLSILSIKGLFAL